MTVHSCTRRFHFSAGHRVYGHESKCAHLHGHNYIVFVTAQADLDNLGRVVDFSVLKTVLDTWIQDRWDHGMLLWEKDPAAAEWLVGANMEEGVFYGQKVAILLLNPTAENLAHILLDKAQQLLGRLGLTITRVRVWETPNCYADATPS